MLDGVNVALGISGSIAAVKVVELAHELRRQGATVRGVMTESAQGIIHPWAVEFATENPVVTEITGQVEHVGLCGRSGWADVLLLAPATANTVGKIATAVDDTPVTTCATTALGADVPVVVVPAMHEPMYDHPGVLDAIETIESWGVTFVSPRIEEEKAKIATEDAIITAVASTVGSQPLVGQHIVVTAGATKESIDPIRVLTNRSSGRTGRAVARECHIRGAEVTLIHTGDDVHYAQTRSVESTADMRSVTFEILDTGVDALICAAAISDYTVDTAPEKIRSGKPRTLELEPTEKLLDGVRNAYPDLPMVGFKAETSGDEESMVAVAESLRDRVDLSFVVANNASVMGDAETRAIIVDDSTTVINDSKQVLGASIANKLAEKFDE